MDDRGNYFEILIIEETIVCALFQLKLRSNYWFNPFLFFLNISARMLLNSSTNNTDIHHFLTHNLAKQIFDSEILLLLPFIISRRRSSNVIQYFQLIIYRFKFRLVIIYWNKILQFVGHVKHSLDFWGALFTILTTSIYRLIVYFTHDWTRDTSNSNFEFRK